MKRLLTWSTTWVGCNGAAQVRDIQDTARTKFASQPSVNSVGEAQHGEPDGFDSPAPPSAWRSPR
eukprot:7256365-Pyramimonas_sp.AAC.1